MDHQELKAEIKEWLGEENYDILQEGKRELNYFNLSIKLKEKSILNFPIIVIYSKQPEALILGFTGWIRGEDNKSFRVTDVKYIEEMLQELWTRATISKLDFSCESKIEETKLRTIKGIYPHEITKEKFFMTISELTEFRKYMHSTFKKYKLSKPKENVYGI